MNHPNDRILYYYKGVREGLRKYAWWKNGVEYVGSCGTTLAAALAHVNKEEQESLDAEARKPKPDECCPECKHERGARGECAEALARERARTGCHEGNPCKDLLCRFCHTGAV